MLSKSSIENQVRYILIIFSVLLFSFTMISCGGSDDNVPGSTNGFFVTVGDVGTILTSSDGTAWDNRISGTTYNLVGITYVNSTFVTVGDNGTILTSSDGTTWTKRTSGTSEHLYEVTYGEGLFVVVGENATILTSSDGITWTERDGLRSKWAIPKYLKGVTYRKKLFVAVGSKWTYPQLS